MQNPISKSTLQRLPIYLGYLKSLRAKPTGFISATTIAGALSLGEVQVRKDLATVCSAGKPKVGYTVDDLINALEDYLGYKDVRDAVIVGAGKLGKALLDYQGFHDYGLNIVAGFNENPPPDGQTDIGNPIFPMSKFEDLCQRLKIRIGIITVPADTAQTVCDLMVKNGILAIWNFAPTHLKAPSYILMQNENMASSLAVLSKHLEEQLT